MSMANVIDVVDLRLGTRLVFVLTAILEVTQWDRELESIAPFGRCGSARFELPLVP